MLERTELPISAVEAPDPGARSDLVLVSVRYEQLAATVPLLGSVSDGSDVLFFGNTVGQSGRLSEALGRRALLGFPAVGGVRAGSTVRYVLIRQQKTMLGEIDGTKSRRVRGLQAVLSEAGFSVRVTSNIDGWLLGHAAFIVPIVFALYRAGGDPARLADDQRSLRLMVRATRQAFSALAASDAEIPTNLKVLYTRMPVRFAVAYWRRVMASGRGELWFGGHGRAARVEMTTLGKELREAVRRAGSPAPELDLLLSGG